MAAPPDNSFHAHSRADWRTWLAGNHSTAANVWLVRYKVTAGRPTLTYDDAVEEALCFGWIDSLPRRLDAERTLLYFAPRQPGSGWSRLNKQRVERLTAAGAMAAAGQQAVAAAQADGSWSLLDAVENLEVPEDLAAALAAHPPAEDHWQGFPRSVKRGILEWIASAKRPATRQKRVQQTAELAQQDQRANQWPR